MRRGILFIFALPMMLAGFVMAAPAVSGAAPSPRACSPMFAGRVASARRLRPCQRTWPRFCGFR
jgi:hypothetical protein